MPTRPHVLVLGGGFAALEAAFLLRMRLRDRVEIKLVSDSDQFLFRPNSIYVPFGADPASLLVDLHKPLRRRDISFEAGTVAEVDPDARLVSLADGQRFGYDKLIVATGRTPTPRRCRASPSTRPRSGRATRCSVSGDFEEARERASRGEAQRVLFLVPPNDKYWGHSTRS